MSAKERVSMVEHEDEVLKNDGAADFIKHSKLYMQQMRYLKIGPPYIRRGRSIFYLKSDLKKWLLEGRVTPGK